jgi:hypothetical protein
MRTVYMIVNGDRGDGFHRLSTGGVWAYATWAAAEEDLSRFLFKGGCYILKVPVVGDPQICASSREQTARWKEKKEKAPRA